MNKLRLEKKATFPKGKKFWPMFFQFVKYYSHQFAIAKGPQDLLNILVQAKKCLFRTWGQRKFFGKNHLPGGKDGFGLLFLVLPVMLLKTQVFEKELFWPSFLVLCSIKNLSEQFITANISFFLLVLPSKTNHKIPFIRFHEVFWHL